MSNAQASATGWLGGTSFILLVQLLTLADCSGLPEVTSVTPSVGSLNGGQRISVKGRHFERNQFTYGSENANLGNKVYLVSDVQVIPCEIHPDGTNEEQIVAYTPASSGLLRSTTQYKIRVDVNGETIPESRMCSSNPDRCKYQATRYRTPRIERIDPPTGPVGTKVNASGYIISGMLNSTLLRDEAYNGVTERITRAFMGGNLCNLLDPEGEPYGIRLYDDWESRYGELHCVPRSTAIGGMRFSILIEGPYGRSMGDPAAFHVGRDNKTYMFQQFAVVSSVSPSSGSTGGRQTLVITGENLDDKTRSYPKVLIADQECEIKSISNDRMVVETPAESSSSGSTSNNPGNRGIYVEIWNNTGSLTVDDVEDLDESDDGYSLHHLDMTTYTERNLDSFLGKMKGYIVPPRTGKYQIRVDSQNQQGRLYFSRTSDPADKVLMYSSDQPSSNMGQAVTTESDKIDLVRDESYFFEAHFVGGAGDSFTLGLMDFNADVNEDKSGYAYMEKQKIILSTTVQPQELTFSLNSWPEENTAASENTVQRLVLGSDNPFRLCIAKFCTGRIGEDTVTEEILTTELNGLVTIIESGDTIAVSQVSGEANPTFDITFQSENGPWGEILVEATDDDIDVSGINVSVTEAGISSYSNIIIGYQGYRTQPIEKRVMHNETARNIEDSLRSLFTTKCHPELANRATSIEVVYFKTFEDEDSQETDNDNRVEWEGEIRDDTIAFCGSKTLSFESDEEEMPLYSVASISNPRVDFSSASRLQLCLAFRGPVIGGTVLTKVLFPGSSRVYPAEPDEYIEAKFRLQTGEILTRSDGRNYTQYQNRWTYNCTDLYKAVKNGLNETGHAMPDATEVYLKEIRVERDMESKLDSAVDNIILFRGNENSKPPGLAARNNQGFAEYVRKRVEPPFTVEELTVSEENGDFTVEIWPHKCFVPDVLEFLNAGDTVTVTEIQPASEPLDGSWSVTLDGETTDEMDTNVTYRGLRDALESALNGSSFEVEHEHTCDRSVFSVKWLSDNGDRELMELHDDQITGTSVTSSVQTIKDGGTIHRPIKGDMLSTYETELQARVWINGFPVRCEGSCSYSYDDSQTPTVTSVSPLTGGLDTVITISGSRFDETDMDNNVVLLEYNGGLTECEVTSASATQFQCTLGLGPQGTYPVQVSVKGKGAAIMDSSVNFAYTADINLVAPVTSGYGGGNTITISGSGFLDQTLTTVNIGSTECVLESVSYSEIICVLDRAVSPTPSDSIVVNLDGTDVTASETFNFDDTLTPKITAMDVETASAAASQTVTIDGTGLSSVSSVKLGVFDAEILSNTDTQLVVKIPPMPEPEETDSYQVLIMVPDNGYALLESGDFPEMTVRFRVDMDASALGTCSVRGGCWYTVAGEGFTTDVEVFIGDTACDVDMDTLTSTQFQCKLSSTENVQWIRNNGIHRVYGSGYSWNRRNITIFEGDIVAFRWEAVLDDQSIRVHETTSITGGEKEGGFSGESSHHGTFSHRFQSVGTHYYSSGPLSYSFDFELKGIIHVVPKLETVEPFRVSINDVDAKLLYTGSSRKKRTAANCPGTPIPDCSVASSLSTGGVVLSPCLTRNITQMVPLNGTRNSMITLTGTNFMAADCIEVTLGDYDCTVQNSNETTLTCLIDGEMEVGQYHKLAVNMNGNGFTAIRIENIEGRNFLLHPHISSISPSEGSVSGGTRITITGGGFTQDTQVSVNSGISCEEVVFNSYYEVVCVTPPASSAMVVDVEVTVENMIAVCEALSCTVEYSLSLTPTVTDVTPSNVEGTDTVFDITGSGFGTDSSLVTVSIMELPCQVSSASFQDTFLSCTLSSGLPNGTHKLVLTKSPDGWPKFDPPTLSDINSTGVITGLNPTSGSTEGGTFVTIQGNGFTNADEMSVTLGDSPCSIEELTASEIVCKSSAQAAQSNLAVTVTLSVDEGGVTDTIDFTGTLTYSYDTAATPTVTAITPTSGSGGDDVIITGTLFSTVPEENTVYVGGEVCDVNTVSAEEINCTVSPNSAGVKSLELHVAGRGNAETSGVTFEYELSITAVDPSEAGHGGEITLTIEGTGLHENISISVCGETCTIISSAFIEATCVLPASTAQSGNVNCDVVVTDNGVTRTLSSSLTYKDDLTSHITSVSPRRGGTGGGTTISIHGSGYGTDSSVVSVTIDGTPCQLVSVDNTLIECQTGPHTRTIRTDVKVFIDGEGTALSADENVDNFWYIDLWSSPYTWGGGDPPVAGDIVVIQRGQTILLDTSTPILKMLLIQGGELIFDDESTNTVHLKAENVLVTDGGLFQIGTEEEPFLGDAVVEMYGQVRSTELPVYGAKTIAIRNGTLEVHGKPIDVTWTLLDQTVSAGDNTITLQAEVNWQVGDEVVIATTGGVSDQHQTEVRVIEAIDATNKILTLTEALEYEHLGLQETYANGGVTLQIRAEVGLLTRNIKFMGNINEDWIEAIEACPDEFDASEFATQNCFSGKFGEEMGSDQFGICLMFHPKEEDSLEAVGHIEYAEISHAGQAFRLGRYPIHFHINGDMTGTYVRGCSIHHTFNRAVNIHNTHNVLVEHNVIYNVMGGALFLEDSIETGNVLQYNLLLFVRASSSLLNDDITPAAFWITHPNNKVRHNHVAGGTHFGFWYRMLNSPEGPSAVYTHIRPRKEPLDEFRNNTVHSVGWYGLWVFEFYDPIVHSRFEGLVCWRSRRGAEWGHVGRVQFVDFVVAENTLAGLEALLDHRHHHISDRYTERGQLFKDSFVISHFNLNSTYPCTKRGIVLPFANGLLIDGVVFVNFDNSRVASDAGPCAAIGTVKITCVCSRNCAGYKYKFTNIEWHNSPSKALIEWEHQMDLEDMDGSLTGLSVTNNGEEPHDRPRVISCTDLMPPSLCSQSAEWSVQYSGCVCSAGTDMYRLTFNNVLPTSLAYRDVVLTNEFGNSTLSWAKLRSTEGKGWFGNLITTRSDIKYTMGWVNADHLTNFSYSAGYYNVEKTAGGGVIMQQNLGPGGAFDRFSVFEGEERDIDADASPSPLTSSNELGDFHWNNESRIVQYMIKSTAAQDPVVDVAVNFGMTRCFYPNCEVPEIVPQEVLELPDEIALFSDPNSWGEAGIGEAVAGWWRADGQIGDGVPVGGSNGAVKIVIYEDKWLQWDVKDAVPIRELEVLGGVKVESSVEEPDDECFTIEATYIRIYGRFMAGEEDHPFDECLDIVLVGDHSTIEYEALHGSSGGPNLGSKAMGVYGGLDLHGKEREIYWTTLDETMEVGDNTITLPEDMEGIWMPGDEIVVATTSLDASETERFVISGVDGNTVTLSGRASYKHLAYEELLSTGDEYSIRAEVGMISRNIRIVGKEYAGIESEAFGARVLVSLQVEIDDNLDVTTYLGWCRLSNVQFYRTGQEGHSDSYDPRYSIALHSLGDPAVTERWSYIKGCSFVDGYNTAMGVFATSNVTIKNNIIVKTVGPSVILEGSLHLFERNLMLSALWPGSYFPNFIEFNSKYWHAAVEIQKSDQVKMMYNSVAGSERIGYRVSGEDCGQSSYLWDENTAHSCLMGVGMFPGDTEEHNRDCAMLHGFTVWKSGGYGLYHQGAASVWVQKAKLMDNRVGMLSLVLYPTGPSHRYAHKSVKITESLVVGTAGDDCDVLPDNHNVQLASLGLAWKCNGNGKTGISFPVFNSKDNMWPTKPFHKAKGDPALYGNLIVYNVTFAHFGESCSARNYMFCTNPLNENIEHPIDLEEIKTNDVDENSYVFNERPNFRDLTIHDCVDMTCDAKRKAFISDNDGSLLGSIGALLPDSGWQYEGDRRYGIGDDRIPTTMKSHLNGTQRRIEDVYSKVGIAYASNGDWKQEMQAFVVTGHRYKMLLMENMDSDAYSRRLSPTAVLNTLVSTMDLINGPGNTGICTGYSCLKRLGVNYAVVAEGDSHDVYFTSTPPQRLRLHLLNASPTSCVVLSVFFMKNRRLDVYYIDDEEAHQENVDKPELERDWAAGGTNRLPKNAVTMPDGRLKFLAPDESNNYLPTCDDDSGANFYSPVTKMLHVTVKGKKPVYIQMMPVVVMKFGVPTLSIDEFFEDGLIENLANLLGVSSDKIKIVDIVSAAGSSRKKREVEVTDVTIEIGNDVTSSDRLSSRELNVISNTIRETTQQGMLPTTLGINIENVLIYDAIPSSDSNEWVIYTENDDLTAIVQGEDGETMQVVQTLSLYNLPEFTYAGRAFKVQPRLRLLDTEGNIARNLVTSSGQPWQVKVILNTNQATNTEVATLGGSTSVNVVDGWANFTDISISSIGEGYVLIFMVSQPSTFKASVTVGNISITKEPLYLPGGAEQHIATTLDLFEPPVVKHEGLLFITQPKLRILDQLGYTMESLPVLEGEQWHVKATLDKSDYLTDSRAVLLGTDTVPFINGIATFTNLAISHSGYNYRIDFEVIIPTNFAHKTYVSSMAVAKRPLEVKVPSAVTVEIDQTFDLSVSLIDTYSREEIHDVYWKGHIWTVSVSLGSSSAILLGEKSTTFGSQIQKAVLNNIGITAPGIYSLKVDVTSTDREYVLEGYTRVSVLSAGSGSTGDSGGTAQLGFVTRKMKMTFEADFDSVVAGDGMSTFSDNFIEEILPLLNDPNIILSNIELSSGSIVVTFDVTGAEDAVDEITNVLYNYVQTGCNFEHLDETLTCDKTLYIDGQPFESVEEANDNKIAGLEKGVFIVVIVTCSLAALLLVGIVVLLMYKLNKPKGKVSMDKGNPQVMTLPNPYQENDGVVWDDKKGCYVNGKGNESSLKRRYSAGNHKATDKVSSYSKPMTPISLNMSLGSGVSRAATPRDVQESKYLEYLEIRPDSKQSTVSRFTPRQSLPEIKSGAVPSVE